MLDSILSQLTLTAEKLLADPALWLCATLLAYALGMWVYKKSGYKTICTPLLVAIVLLVVTLELTGTDYKTYLNGGQHINFLLGPATVALAVPLYEQRLRLAKMWVALTCGLIAGGTVAIVSAVLIAGVLGASPETMISLAPKSVTVPIAMAVSEHLGGIPALTAALGRGFTWLPPRSFLFQSPPLSSPRPPTMPRKRSMPLWRTRHLFFRLWQTKWSGGWGKNSQPLT